MEIASQPVIPQPVAQPSATSPVVAPPVGAPDAAAAPAAAFKNQDRFNELIERVSNKSHTFSETEQLDAYVALQDMAVTGGLRDMGADNNKLYNESGGSAIAQKVKNLRLKLVVAQIDGYRNGGGSASQQAGLDVFDKLSPSDQDVLFRGAINASDMTGARPFADKETWRNGVVASIKLLKYIETASGDQQPVQAAERDPKIAAAIRLADVQAGARTASWIQQIADFLGEREPVKDKVDLSDDAKRVLGTQAPASKAPVQSPYQTGSVTSLRV